MPDSRRYNDEDVQAIIQGALKQQGTATGDLTHADLLSIGEQIGLPAEAIERAAYDVLEARRATQATQRVTSSRRRICWRREGGGTGYDEVRPSASTACWAAAG
jgi:hypothetical protein